MADVLPDVVNIVGVVDVVGVARCCCCCGEENSSIWRYNNQPVSAVENFPPEIQKTDFVNTLSAHTFLPNSGIPHVGMITFPENGATLENGMLKPC
jgi:hypothetical protein